ncbi:MAG: type II toxin-antitoxin system VapC family toxin [Candidatus Sulfotelmatobacter sp.]
MPVEFLLDTNIASYVINGKFSQVRERLLKIPIRSIGISVITEAELRFGVARLQQAGKLTFAVEEFLLRVEVLPWDSVAASHYARLRAALEKDGEPMGNLDLMIAAQALAAAATLITNDRSFRRIKDLKIQDWTKP